jgi:hypothetical protein
MACRSVPKLGRSQSRMKSATSRLARFPRIDRALISRHGSRTDGLTSSPQLRGQFRPPGFPCSAKRIPYSWSQGIGRYCLGNARITQLWFRQQRQISGEFPCIFPADQGSDPRDECAPAAPPPPESLPKRRLSPHTARRLGKKRDSAGSWPRGVARRRDPDSRASLGQETHSAVCDLKEFGSGT